MRVLTCDPMRWSDLGLRPGIDVGPFTVRFYALAYILGIPLSYWHLLRMVRAPGSPMTREQVDDLVLAATIGIIVGGRVGFATFYERLIREPDAQLAGFAERTGLHMGQWLTLPLIALGVVLVVRAARRPALEVADVAGVPG